MRFSAGRMGAGSRKKIKREFVKVLLTLAALYSCRLEVNRDSPDEVLRKALKRVALKTHPDKGAQLEHAQSLNAAKEAWDKSRGQGKKARRGKAGGNKAKQHSSSSVAVGGRQKERERRQSERERERGAERSEAKRRGEESRGEGEETEREIERQRVLTFQIQQRPIRVEPLGEICCLPMCVFLRTPATKVLTKKHS